MPACDQSQGLPSIARDFRKARQTSKPRIAYSVTCAIFRTVKTHAWTALSDIWGNSQCKIGARMREEWLKDMLSLEAEKIIDIQIMMGSQ